MPLVNILFWSVLALAGILLWVSIKRNQKEEEELAELLNTLLQEYERRGRRWGSK